jgi:hypothetical protein
VRFEHWRDHAPPPGAPSRVERYVIDQRARPGRVVRRRRCRAWNVGVRASAGHFGVLVAALHRAAPARCGALADEGRIVAGDGRRASGDTNIHPIQRYRTPTTSVRVLAVSLAAGAPPAGDGDRSRFPPFDPVREAGADNAPYDRMRIATFRRAAPARCGAIADEGPIVSATQAD